MPFINIFLEGEEVWVTESQLLALWPGAMRDDDGVFYLPGEFTKFPDDFEMVTPEPRTGDDD